MLKKRTYARLRFAAFASMLAIAASTAFGQDLQAEAKRGGGQDPLFLTETNGTANFLVVINSRTKQMNFVPTGGNGGVGGNAGGVAVEGKLAAAKLWLSTVHIRPAWQCNGTDAGHPDPPSHRWLDTTTCGPGLTTADSFPVWKHGREKIDGLVQLLKGDKSAAQSLDGGAYIRKKGLIANRPLNERNGGPCRANARHAALAVNDTPFAWWLAAPMYATVCIPTWKLHRTTDCNVTRLPYKAVGGFFTPCWNTLNGQFLFG